VRVFVVGATGDVGRALLSGLISHPAIDHVISLADDLLPADMGSRPAGVERRRADLSADLSPQFQFSDAIVYAGGLTGGFELTPSDSRHLDVLANVCACAARAGVRAFVYGSSAAAYSAAPHGAMVDEDCSTGGLPSSPTSLQIARGDRLVSDFAAEHPIIRVVVLRPAIIICPRKPSVGWRARLFKRIVGGIVVGHRIRIVPDLGPRGIQVIHVADLVDAFCRAVTGSVVGSFNLAADPITSDLLATYFKAKKVPMDLVLKVHSYAQAVGLALLNTEALRLGLQTPRLSTVRADRELGWTARHSALSVLEEWAATFTTSEPQETGPASEIDSKVGEPTARGNLVILYEHALGNFGQLVRAIRDDQWTLMTGYEGFDVWQLVASVACELYRTDARLRGESAETFESQLPHDPLGFSRSDGWDLAAERAMSAVREGRAFDAGLIEVLPDVIRSIDQAGECLARAIELPLIQSS
jgi:nucleoside-diphosphate-sugar epimerase